jgi:hypothetical protein
MIAEQGVLWVTYPPGGGWGHNHEQLQSPFAADLFCFSFPTEAEKLLRSTGSKLTSKG